MNNPHDPMPGDIHDYSPANDEERRRQRQMDEAPSPKQFDEEADRIRRLKGGGGFGGTVGA